MTGDFMPVNRIFPSCLSMTGQTYTLQHIRCAYNNLKAIVSLGSMLTTMGEEKFTTRICENWH